MAGESRYGGGGKLSWVNGERCGGADTRLALSRSLTRSLAAAGEASGRAEQQNQVGKSAVFRLAVGLNISSSNHKLNSSAW